MPDLFTPEDIKSPHGVRTAILIKRIMWAALFLALVAVTIRAAVLLS